MARFVVYYKYTEKGDRSLIDHIYGLSGIFPRFTIERDGLKNSLKESGINETLSLTIKNVERDHLVAAIPEAEPFTIMLFDESSIRFIEEMIAGLLSTKVVLIEIQ